MKVKLPSNLNLKSALFYSFVIYCRQITQTIIFIDTWWQPKYIFDLYSVSIVFRWCDDSVWWIDKTCRSLSTSGPAADVNGTQYNRAGPGGQWCTWYTVHNREGLQTMYHDAPNDLIIIVKWSIYIVYILVLVLSSWIIGGYSAVFNLLLAQQGLLSTQICWKSSNLNNFDIKWSQNL